MRIVYKCCCGMDVHKDSVTACVLLIDEYGEWRSEKRKFRTMTRDLREMSAWLASLDVEAIAMEATGIYWKPVWNILEAEKKFHLLLVNAHHIKQVPGRKTDQKDSEWIADLRFRLNDRFHDQLSCSVQNRYRYGFFVNIHSDILPVVHKALLSWR